MSPTRVGVLCIAAVIAYDAAASTASLAFGFSYAYAGVGSILIYAASGFFAARTRTLWFSLLVGVIAGVADATVGWGVSWAVGPGRPPSGSLTFTGWLATVASVVVLASVCAGIGGVVGRFTRRLQSARVA